MKNKMKTRSGAAKRFKKTANGFKRKQAFKSHILTKKSAKRAKGYYGARSRVYRVAVQAVTKAGQYAYRDRRNKKRTFRRLWIARINAGARLNGLSYSRFINGMKKANISIDRRVLADIAMHDAATFTALVEKAKAELA